MTEPSATIPTTAAPPTRLEPDAIGVAQDTVIGMATSAPAAVVAITLAGLALTGAYGGGPLLLVAAIPMLIIANAYRRLNMWNANSGASFDWVGRAINPYLGFLTGWLMIAGYILGTLSGVEVLGPSVLAIFGNSATNTWGNVAIATAVGLVMMVIAVIGIRITARTQVAMALVEYAILVGVSVWGLVAVLSHHVGTYHVTSGWFSLSGIGGKGDVVGGFLIAVFAYSGWDGSIYVNEEVKHRRVNPGRAAMIAVALLAVIYIVAQVGLQGVVSPKLLQANSTNALVYVAGALGGGGWAKAMALALALSVIATTGCGIVVGARIIYGMAGYRALPGFLASVPRRFATPAAASIVFGLVVVALAWVYLLATSVETAFTYVVDLTGLLFAIFYVLTALAAIAYYRRRIFARAGDALVLGLLPLGSSGFLVWMVERSLATAPLPERWSMVGIVGVGLLLMLVARFLLKSSFFQLHRESASATGEVQVSA
ncbi:MAG TPA: APC family permease [Solirubrobacteraceae bacterium]|nr:APC family permease [Solirubrobacteraceae bacterium]